MKRSEISVSEVIARAYDLATDPEEPLDFYAAAIAAGARPGREADDLATEACESTMRARGAI